MMRCRRESPEMHVEKMMVCIVQQSVVIYKLFSPHRLRRCPRTNTHGRYAGTRAVVFIADLQTHGVHTNKVGCSSSLRRPCVLSLSLTEVTAVECFPAQQKRRCDILDTDTGGGLLWKTFLGSACNLDTCNCQRGRLRSAICVRRPFRDA